jgi:hypothetical protein
MRTRAGEMRVQLPDDWADASEYAYCSPEESASLRISRLKVVPASTPRGLLADKLDGLSALGQVTISAQEELSVDHRPAAAAHVIIEFEYSAKTEGKTVSRAKILVVKPDEGHAVCAVLIERDLNEFAMKEVWTDFLENLKFHPPNA